MIPAAARIEVEACPRSTWMLVELVSATSSETRAGLFVRKDDGQASRAWWSLLSASGARSCVPVPMGKA